MIRKYEPMGPPKPSATVKCLQRDQPNSGVGASVGAGGRDLFFCGGISSVCFSMNF